MLAPHEAHFIKPKKQNHFFSHGGIFHASPSLLGKNQKVSLKSTARVVPHEFPHHISSAQCRKYFVGCFAHYSTLFPCQDYPVNCIPCTNLRENGAYTRRWRTSQTLCEP